MRKATARNWVLCFGCALAPSIATAQQPPNNITSISVEEPRSFPQPAAMEARPLGYSPRQPAGHQAAPASHRVQPPVNFRLASAEQPIQSLSSRPPLKLAPKSSAARPSAARPASPSPLRALSTVLGSLGAVLAVFIVIVWCSKRFAPAGSAALPKEAIELLGRGPLLGRQQMHLIRIGNKLLLVTISPVGMETLTEITDATEVEHLLALCNRTQGTSASAAFQQALTQLASEPAPRGFVGASRSTSRGAT
jgi:flagellar biogenesis protein FliO